MAENVFNNKMKSRQTREEISKYFRGPEVTPLDKIKQMLNMEPKKQNIQPASYNPWGKAKEEK